MKCIICGTSNPKGQWWGLSGYFGLSGRFCPICYDKVSHDAYGKPNNPVEFEKILKQSQKQSKNQRETK
jgi:hypothetical protein